MNIYIGDISPLQSVEQFKKMLSFVSEERRIKIESMRSEKGKMQSLGAGLLLEYGLNQYHLTLRQEGRGSFVKVELGEHGKPQLPEETGLFFNLSHAGNYVAGIFTKKEAGIDVEQIKPNTQKVAARFFTKEESIVAAKDGAERFTELWTRKESYVKAIGTGLYRAMDSFCVLGDCVTEDDRKEVPYFLKTWELLSGYRLSACCREPINVEPQWISLLEKESFFDGNDLT